MEAADGTVVRKLGQKVRADPGDPAEVWITNLYLDEAEYDGAGRPCPAGRW